METLDYIKLAENILSKLSKTYDIPSEYKNYIKRLVVTTLPLECNLDVTTDGKGNIVFEYLSEDLVYSLELVVYNSIPITYSLNYFGEKACTGSGELKEEEMAIELTNNWLYNIR